MIASDPDRRRRVWRRHPSCSFHFEQGEQAVGTPVADPCQNRIGGSWEERFGTVVDIAKIACDQPGGVHDIDVDAGFRGGINETPITGGVGSGAEDEDLHGLILARTPHQVPS